MKAKISCFDLRPFLILLVLSFLFTGCKQALADEKGNDSQDQRAKEIYDQYCSNCHGKDLRGGNAQSLLDGVWQFGDGSGWACWVS